MSQPTNKHTNKALKIGVWGWFGGPGGILDILVGLSPQSGAHEEAKVQQRGAQNEFKEANLSEHGDQDGAMLANLAPFGVPSWLI